MPELKVAVKVVCPGNEFCHNPECMHYKKHEPIWHGEKPYQNCHEGKTICPLIGAIVQCK